MYKLVFDNVSVAGGCCCCCCGVALPFVATVVFVFVLLRLVLTVPLCDPVLDELLEFVLLGDVAVGTR